MADSENKIFHLTTHRLEALSDGIFAIAMTILVLNLVLPEGIPGAMKIDLAQLIIGQVHKFFHYALSFLLLALFWMVHHQQFNHIKRLDSNVIWINIFLLMLVVLIPFSTDVVGDYPGETLGVVFFAGNLLILSLLFLVNWTYATHKHRLVDAEMDERIVIRGIRRNLVSAAVSLLVIIFAFIIPNYVLWFYLVVPLVLSLKPFRSRQG